MLPKDMTLQEEFNKEMNQPGVVWGMPDYIIWLENKLIALSQKVDIYSDPPPDGIVFLKAETETVRKALLYFEKLDLTGLAVRIDGSIRAFTVGEKLNNRTALIHIEKADHTYLGLSQFWKVYP